MIKHHGFIGEITAIVNWQYGFPNARTGAEAQKLLKQKVAEGPPFSLPVEPNAWAHVQFTVTPIEIYEDENENRTRDWWSWIRWSRFRKASD
jgi:hypothetical protein